MQTPIAPVRGSVPPLPQKTRRWPCLVAGCGCLTLIAIVAGIVATLYFTGMIGGQDTSSKLGDYEWRRDSDGAIMFFDPRRNAFIFEIAGSKYGGVVHVNGYWRMSGNIMTYKLGYNWLDTGQVTEKGTVSRAVAEELRIGKDQTLRLAWQGDDTFTLSERWSLVPRETWRRQSKKKESHNWHYPPVHRTPEHWVDGQGWVPDNPTPPSTTTTRPAPSVAPQAAELARDKEAIARAAIAWLQVLDTDYRASYYGAGAGFRKGTTLEQWRTALSGMRSTFGKVKSRDPNAAITRSDSESGGVTTSTYRMEIHTTFTKRNGTETITLALESGEWKVSDYSIETAR